MAQCAHLHVGPPKTGTTFLQSGWRAQRERLLADGLLHPGNEPADQFRACMVAIDHPTFVPRMDEHRAGTWNRFLDEIQAHPGDALLSSEFYARADDATAERVVKQLKDVAGEVHVVVTTRDLGRQLLASWQQKVKRGSTRTLQGFWDKVKDDPVRTGPFWRNQDIPRLARRWLDAGADALTLVVVGAPGAPRDRIWHDMSGLLGIGADPVPVPSRTNSSLGAVEVEVLRRLNRRLPRGLDRVRTANLTSKYHSDRLHALGLPRVEVPVSETLATEVRDAADEQVAQLRRLAENGEIRVVGDLEHLRSRLDPCDTTVTDADIADASARLLASMVGDQLEANDRAAERRREIDHLREELGLGRTLRRYGRRVLRLRSADAG